MLNQLYGLNQSERGAERGSGGFAERGSGGSAERGFGGFAERGSGGFAERGFGGFEDPSPGEAASKQPATGKGRTPQQSRPSRGPRATSCNSRAMSVLEASLATKGPCSTTLENASNCNGVD